MSGPALEAEATRLEAWCTARPPGGPPAPRRFAALCPPLPADLRVVKVAGTDGKGSTSAMLDAMLGASGEGVVLFTSPHLSRINERVRLDGQDLGDAALLEALHAAEARARAAEAAGGARPSFFELLLLAAVEVVRASGARWLVAEAGVGGRTDATAALPARVCALTTVGADHLDKLGPTLADVAAHKAGVAPPGCPLVLGPAISAELAAVVAAAAAPGVRLRRAARAPGREGTWSSTLHTTPPLELPLAGAWQLDNAGVALAVLDELIAAGLAAPAWAQGLARTRWPGRLEHLDGPAPWVLDAAHNPHAAAALGAALEGRVPWDQRLLVLGCSRGHEAALPALSALAPACVLVEGFHRAAPAAELARFLHAGTTLSSVYPDPEAAVAALDGGPDGRVRVLAGSIFLLGAARPLLVGRRSLSGGGASPAAPFPPEPCPC